MTRTRLRTRYAAAAVAITLLAGLTALPAAARSDSGDQISVRFDIADVNCPLRRIGAELVRCDNLTGAGASAPVWVPVL